MQFPFDIPGRVSDEQAKRRVAINQTHLRRVNEAMRTHRADEALAFRCECGRLGCNHLISLTRDEYNAVRAHPARFAIVPGHEIDAIEATVERYDRYAVVEAHDPVATAVVEETSPGRRARD